jgi:uncharacterized protein YoxC
MTIVEIAVLLIAVGFAVLVGYLIPILIQLKKTITEADELLTTMNAELPLLLKEMRETNESLNALADHVRSGVEHASGFLHAIGSVGDTVQQVNDVVRSTSGSLVMNLASIAIAGFRAVSSVVKERFQKEEGGDSHGG